MHQTTAYLARELSAASPAKRVAMLLDRALASLGEVGRAIERGDIQGRWTANNQAVNILETLWMTLDLEKGGEIAANLDKLYRFMLQHLTLVDLKNDPKPAAEVAALLEPLRRSWHEIALKEATAAVLSQPQQRADASSATIPTLALSA